MAASTSLVLAAPAIHAARAAFRPASIPWVLRRPKSTTGRPRAARTERTAFDAITVCRCAKLITAVSTSWASLIGAVTSISGSSGKTTVPSGTARTMPVKRSARSESRNAASKMRRPARKSIAVSEKLSALRYSSTSSRPEATRNDRPGGSLRTKRLKVASPCMPSRKYDAAIVSS
jgi:hypothetical protein